MRLQAEQWQQVEDRRAIFLNCYSLMTANMLAAIDSGEFNDPEWVYSLLEHFAEYYFNALDAYQQTTPFAPPIWRLTFDADNQPDTLVAQNLMLGINAHINYDLTLALVDMLSPDWAQLSPDERQGRYDDHTHVNQVIARTIDAVQETVVEPASPVMNVVDVLMGPVDEWATSRVISEWRDVVWQQAMRLIEAADETEARQLRRQQEDEALQRARLILRLG
jgi:hypothetical protein